jgi:hypothetical protein
MLDPMQGGWVYPSNAKSARPVLPEVLLVICSFVLWLQSRRLVRSWNQAVPGEPCRLCVLDHTSILHVNKYNYQYVRRHPDRTRRPGPTSHARRVAGREQNDRKTTRSTPDK